MNEYGETAAGIDYSGLDKLIDRLNGVGTAAEMHGMICGELAAGMEPQQSGEPVTTLTGTLAGTLATEQRVVDGAELMLGADEIPSSAVDELVVIREQVLSSLQDLNMSFEPLLPEDSIDLQIRTEALGQWCEGFLVGFALAGQADMSPPAEISEIIKDFAAIANVGVEIVESVDSLGVDSLGVDSLGETAVEDLESAEGDFLQLIEYVRVAVLTVYANYAAQAQPGPQAGPQIH